MNFLRVILTLLLLAVSNSVVADPWIQFRSSRDNDDAKKYSEFIMNPDGTDPVNISERVGIRHVYLIWSPDGTKIAFAQTRQEDVKVDFVRMDIIPGPREIWVINADGSNLVNLTNHDGDDTRPRWSPDGTKILFNSNRNDETELFVINSDGTNLSSLGPGFNPRWSPDGTKIGFQMWSGAFVMDADGSGRRKIAAFKSFISWSPDGTMVSLYGGAGDHRGHGKLYVANADGTDLMHITKGFTPANGFRHLGGGAWSPDGRQIAFSISVNNWGDGGPVNFDIYVVNVDGTDPVKLTNHRSSEGAASWSPDGSKILYGRGSEIYIMDADGSNPVNLTNHPAPDRGPSWLSFKRNVQTTEFTPEDKLVTTWGRIKAGASGTSIALPIQSLDGQ